MPADTVSENNPCVSIVMPAYNAELTIEQAIESVLQQSFCDWELIVIDDGSVDATASVVQSCSRLDARIHCITLQSNSGSPATPRNHGIGRARGEYIAFLDADDKWTPAKLERQLQFVQSHSLEVCATAVDVVNIRNEVVGRRAPTAKVTYQSLLKHNPLILSTVLLKKSFLGERRFKPLGHEDYLLWLELARAGAVLGVMPEVLGWYRQHAGSVSANKLKVVAYFWNIYFRQLRYSRLTSVYFTARYLLFAVWRGRKELATRLKI
ncbi:glycosyltransferase family 2 protein [Gilvimarinus sp. 1_MG-2023]|uniref:glycosyltransferase family 2 protein n=1 Tax=Gilvimarinus sp. 1_MG-2023 TaxID=3062638 RepID=UPI0026E34C64|nr:glycosyltransferase family 2 protein [Gilvimarinus sp. 1_MG-2023]MDO6746784.1 glycosyltransferase family 2 protein [Gilvimarinus sp. 1_MG-2023]